MTSRSAIALAWTLGALALAAPASAQPTISSLGACGFSGSLVTFNGNSFDPGQMAVVELMSTRDPLAGLPVSSRVATADSMGNLSVRLDVPPVAGTTPVVRAVRVRPVGAGVPTVLATARVKTASRAVLVSPKSSQGTARTTERWHVTGLPVGIKLWAHYRHRGKTVARVALRTVKDDCGQLSVALGALPAGHVRAGAWDVWLTADRTFRVPRTGVYVQRHMTVAGDRPGARVRFAGLRARLVPTDPRVSAPPTNLFLAYATPIGLIHLVMGGAQGAPVQFFERIGDRLKPLGSARALPGQGTNLLDATTWSCTQRSRRFVGTATLPDGSPAFGVGVVETPTCASRFLIRAPRRVAPGRAFGVRVIDRWGNGSVAPTLCVTPPGRRESCRTLAFPKAVAIATRDFRAGKRGAWKVDLRIQGSHTRTTVGVGEPSATAKAEPTLLATGDSMMYGIDSSLIDELLGVADVRSDVKGGTGISDSRVDWVRIAARQARSVRPQDTVIMIGANDGYPMVTPAGAKVTCCDEPWAAEYQRRVRAIMRSYAQHGRGRVFWLTLPLPRQAARAAISTLANLAVVRAAPGVAGVTVVRLDQVFTPAGYSDFYRYRGRNVRVREFDGIHLNVQGQAIAGEIVSKLIRRAGA
jgi:lysophospholipase L1-like esterase